MVGESRFGGITRGGFFGLMLVGGLVIGLFFIPELLQLRSRSVATSSPKISQSKEVLTAADTTPAVTSSQPVSVTPEPRSSSSGSWWSDIKSWFAGFSSPRLAHKAQEREANSRSGTRDDARASLASVAQKMDSSRSGSPTWNSIRSQESKEAVSQARRDALELSRSLPSSASSSKFAMIDFANGLDFVMTKADQQMSPRDAIVYLSKLDQSVSRSLAEDKVDRIYVRRWSQLSLGPVLGKTMLGQRHDVMLAPFDPQLTMTQIRLKHKGMRRGNPATGKVELTISGYLIGDDIRKVTMEANDGALLLTLALKKDPRGFWFFNRGSIDGRQTWTFKVYDKFGDQYHKTYRFYPRASAFGYEKPEGYKIPFRMARATVGEFRSQDFDPQLDRFFTTAVRGDPQADSNALFTTF